MANKKIILTYLSSLFSFVMYKIVIGGISTECSSYSPLFQNNIDFKRIEGDKLIKHVDFDFKKYNVRIYEQN